MELPVCRPWPGLTDGGNPLGRVGHVSFAYGRFIYLFGGAKEGNSPDKEYIFDRVGLTRFDILTNSVCFIPIHWDLDSLNRHGLNQFMLPASGACLAVHSSSHSSSRDSCTFYVFGGFSAHTSAHQNILLRFDLPSSLTDGSKRHNYCCQARAIAGYSLLSSLTTANWQRTIYHTVLLTLLQLYRRRLLAGSHKLGRVMNRTRYCVPSPRDKLCMEYWRQKLYIFGGYGPSCSTVNGWPHNMFQWPFLNDSRDQSEWVCQSNGLGWNNQLICFDLSNRQFSIIRKSEQIGRSPSPRAAHQSVLDEERGWMFIFGGRGAVVSTECPMGRMNDLYCLNLDRLEWTRVITPLDSPDIRQTSWPCGRAMFGMCMHKSTCGRLESPCIFSQASTRSDQSAIHLFISGGWSNHRETLSDAFPISITHCSDHQRLEAQVRQYHVQGQSVNPSAQSFQEPQVHLQQICYPDADLYTASTFLVDSKLMKQAVILDPDELASEDVAYISSIYASLELDTEPVKFTESNQFFRYIGHQHTKLLHFILDHYSLLGQTQCPNTLPVPIESFLESIDAAIAELRLFIPESSIATMFGYFIMFMPLWQPIKMLLLEDGLWGYNRSRKKLLRSVFSTNSNPSSSQPIKIASLDRNLLVKLKDLLPTHRRDSENWSQPIVYTYVKYLIEWLMTELPMSSPSKSQVWALPMTELRASVSGNLIVPRYWHSVNLPIDKAFIIIGGNEANDRQPVVERFRIVEPLDLTSMCLKLLCCILLDLHNGQLKQAYRVPVGSSSFASSATIFGRQEGAIFSPNFDQLKPYLDDTVLCKLERWFM